MEKAKSIVMSDGMIDFIADKTYQYYIAQDTETSYTDSLREELKQVEAATANLVRALEAGIFNAATKTRMDELEQQKEALETALADAELISGLRLTKDHIKFFLLQFRSLNFDEPESQRRIIDSFVNAVFVYDDRVTITFNYSGDNRTITLAEVDGASESVRALSATGHHVVADCVSFATTFSFSRQTAPHNRAAPPSRPGAHDAGSLAVLPESPGPVPAFFIEKHCIFP